MGDGLGSTIVLIIVLVLVMLAAYYTTKFLSSKTKRLNKGKYLEIKDRMYVGRDKHIVLLEAGEQYFIVGVTNQSINLLGTLKKEEISPVEEVIQDSAAFTGIKGLFGKLSGAVKNASQAQEELRKARMAARVEKDIGSAAKTQEEQDEIDRILNAIQQRKSRGSGNNNPKGDL